jgi:hypothetical protein
MPNRTNRSSTRSYSKALALALLFLVSAPAANSAHAAFWTIIGTGNSGDVTGMTFGVTLDTDKKEFIANGPDVDKFFVTKKGKFNLGAIPELGTQLLKADNTEAAFFTNLFGNSVVGATGTGRASEKGVVFDWKLDSK